MTAAELERGWVDFVCPSHGFLVATTSAATVTCRCGKRGRMERLGRPIERRRTKPLQTPGSDSTKTSRSRSKAPGRVSGRPGVDGALGGL